MLKDVYSDFRRIVDTYTLLDIKGLVNLLNLEIEYQEKQNELEELYDKSRVFVNIISVNVAEYAEKHFNKAVKKTVTIPQWMADMAESKKLKLSKILQEALKEKLKIA